MRSKPMGLPAQILAVMLACIGVSAPAFAGYIYTYTGNNFEYFWNAGGGLTTSDHMSLTFSVDNLIAANSTNFATNSWSFSAGGFTVSSSTAGSTFSISFYSLGVDNNPTVSCFQGTGGGISFAASIGPSAGSMLTATTCPWTYQVQEVVYVSAGAASASNGSSPGTWSHREEVTGTVPEPGTLALLVLGLAGLGLSRRRKAA